MARSWYNFEVAIVSRPRVVPISLPSRLTGARKIEIKIKTFGEVDRCQMRLEMRRSETRIEQDGEATQLRRSGTCNTWRKIKIGLEKITSSAAGCSLAVPQIGPSDGTAPCAGEMSEVRYVQFRSAWDASV